MVGSGTGCRFGTQPLATRASMTDKETMEALVAGKTFVHPDNTTCRLDSRGNLCFEGGPGYMGPSYDFPHAKHGWRLQKRVVYLNVFSGERAKWFHTAKEAREHATSVASEATYFYAIAEPMEVDA